MDAPPGPAARQRSRCRPTPFAGMTRIRCEGLRCSPALSALGGAPLSHSRRYTRLRRPAHLAQHGCGRACDPGRVLLRMLREPHTGRPGPLARLLAVLVLLGMIGLAAPVLVPLVFWVLRLL